MRRIILFITLTCLLKNSAQRSTLQDDHYVAAVVEYQLQADISTNIQNYIKLIQDAAAQFSDVVVFPEMTLTRGARAVPVPMYGLLREFPIPALRQDLYDEILVNISSAARQHQVYVVINVQEEMNCASAVGEHCPETKVYLFNTNVVFDRAGAVIDRYRKINLFGEYTRNPALKPELGVFTTDFGVTFGHYICFDLMFQVPSVQVVKKNNITDIIFTTMWFSEMPFLSAVQIQEAYAYIMNVNFLASGANNLLVGSAGSGIYSGKAGALVSVMPGVPTTRLLVSRVPKVPGQINFEYPGPLYDDPKAHDRLTLIADPSLPSHISRPLVNGFQEFTLVDKEVSCKFTVTLNQREGETNHQYRAFVHDGSKGSIYVHRTIGVASCLIVACKNDDLKSCAYRYSHNKANIDIEDLEIEMTTYQIQYNSSMKCDNVLYYPSSLRINKFPLRPTDFTFSTSNIEDITENSIRPKENGREKVTYKLNAPQNDLISFGIYGRVFTKDVNQAYVVTEDDIKNDIALENELFAKAMKVLTD